MSQKMTEKRRRYMAAAARRKYHLRKAAGLCVRCGSPAIPDTVLCEKHTRHNRAKQRAYDEHRRLASGRIGGDTWCGGWAAWAIQEKLWHLFEGRKVSAYPDTDRHDYSGCRVGSFDGSSSLA